MTRSKRSTPAGAAGQGKPLAGRASVVAGATRGVGRGAARMLGEAGATVYCTGRSSRAAANTGASHDAERPETIEETAELVDAAGGVGIPVRVDHAVEGEVAALFDRVKREAKRLDVLVTVLGGPPAGWDPFWKQPLAAGRATVEGWLWPHLITCWHAAKLMAPRRAGLIVEITEGHTVGAPGNAFYEVARVALKRLTYDLAEELAPHGITALSVAPGFMRTEGVLRRLGATEDTWREVAATNSMARRFGLAGSESPCFVGRAVAALAADPRVARKSGGIFGTWALADEYGFTDVDGRRPHWGRYVAENFPAMATARPRTGRTWEVVAAAAG